MAFVTLKNLLEDNKNLYGLVSADAPCIVRIPEEALKIIKPKALEELRTILEGDQYWSPAKFVELLPDWAQPEWAFNPNGCLTAWQKTSSGVVNLIELDLSEWFKQQDDGHLRRLAAFAFHDFKQDEDDPKAAFTEATVQGIPLNRAKSLIANRSRDLEKELAFFVHLGKTSLIRKE